MNADIKIIQVLNTGKSSDQHGLVFKVKWDNSDEFAYIQFDVAKKKYPSIVLDYLIARIKQKPINQPHKQIQ